MYEDHWRWQNNNPLVVPDMGVARCELLRHGAPSAKPTTWAG
jgi:hypothetical protein